ncbi:MAG: hypothetical protein WBV81_04270 [Ignavibacteriaceae bacterium]
MKKYKYIALSTLTFVLLFSENILSQNINNSLGLNVFNSFAFWEDPYQKGGYDNLGIGTYLSPTYKMNINKYYFQLDFMLSYFHFIGPDGLTRTGPDDDIDFGFHSHINRNDLGIKVGYNLLDNLTLLIESKYIYLQIKGSVDRTEIIQSPFDYIERGFLLGPGINLNYPKKSSNSYFSLSASYLMGNLNYTYNSFNIQASAYPIRDKITTQLLSTNLGYNIHLNSKFLLGVSLESNYFFKRKFTYDYNYDSNLWFIGLSTSIFYQL